MTIFYPNLNPDSLLPENRTVYVFNYWEFNPNIWTFNYGPFVPKNLQFSLPIGIDEVMNAPIIRLTPNSFVETMSVKEYNELVETQKNTITQIFIDNSLLSNDPFKPGRYLVPFLVFQPIIVAGETFDSVKNQLFGQNNLGPYSMFLPKMTRKTQINSISDLYGTYCQYSHLDQGLVGCGRCLFHEQEYMTIPGGWDSITDNISVAYDFVNKDFVVFYQHPEVLTSNELKRQNVPACELCAQYIVYCSPIGLNNIDRIGVLLGWKPIRSFKGLILDRAILYIDDLPEGAKLFRTREEANIYFDEIINETALKWICIPEPGYMGPNTPYECVEVLESCIDAFANEEETIQSYDSKEECEENCSSTPTPTPTP